MTQEKPWPSLLRRLHLSGGLRVEEFAPGKAQLYPVGKGATACELQISSYGAIGQDIRRYTGLRVLGCEFLRTEEDLDGLSQPEWRAVVPRNKNEWPTYVAELNWSGLANAARERRDSHLFLIAGSIKSQCRFSAMRLLDLSERYLKTLTSLLKTKAEPNSEHVYRDSLSDPLFTSIHAAFFEMATLRDYLAEYVAYVVYGNEKVDSFKKLHDFVADNGCETPLEQQISDMCSTNGWLKAFSDRRNTIAHRMPFDRLSGSGVMHLKDFSLPPRVKTWMLHLPVPDPIPVSYKSKYDLPCNDADIASNRFDEITAARERQDTLAYLFGVFGKLIDFANNLSNTFPYQPKMFTITDDMIVSVSIE